MTSSDFSRGVPSDFAVRLIPRVPVDVGHRPHEISLVPSSAFTAVRSPYAEEFFEAVTRFPTSSMAFTNAEWLGSPLSLSGRITALQDFLRGTDYCFAPPSQRDTSLQHRWSPSSTGSLLRGSLVITTTGLPPASKQRLFKAHQHPLAADGVKHLQ